MSMKIRTKMLMFLKSEISSLLLDDFALIIERTMTMIERTLMNIKQGSDDSAPFLRIKKVGTPFPE